MVESGSDPLPICQPTAFITVVFNIYLKPGSPIILYYPRSSVSNKMIVYPLRCTTGLHARTHVLTHKKSDKTSFNTLSSNVAFLWISVFKFRFENGCQETVLKFSKRKNTELSCEEAGCNSSRDQFIVKCAEDKQILAVFFCFFFVALI